jgi:hypothetical protein
MIMTVSDLVKVAIFTIPMAIEINAENKTFSYYKTVCGALYCEAVLMLTQPIVNMLLCADKINKFSFKSSKYTFKSL